MRSKNILRTVTGLSVFPAQTTFAHIVDSGPGLPGVLTHWLTGVDHLLLVVVGAGVVYLMRSRRQGDK